MGGSLQLKGILVLKLSSKMSFKNTQMKWRGRGQLVNK